MDIFLIMSYIFCTRRSLEPKFRLAVFLIFNKYMAALEDTQSIKITFNSRTVYDIADTTLQQIILFLVFDNPLPLIRVRKVNKHFYDSLDAAYDGTNFIWRTICRNKWTHISPHFHTKRWDKLYQLRTMAIKRDYDHFKQMYNNHGSVNTIADIEDIVIEGCQYGMPSKHKLCIKQNDCSDMSRKLKDFTFEDINIKNSLYHDGQVWFIKCPMFMETQRRHNHYLDRVPHIQSTQAIQSENDMVLTDQLPQMHPLLMYPERLMSNVTPQPIYTDAYTQQKIMRCEICKKDVYLVSTDKGMKEHLDKGSCVSLSQKLDIGCVVM
eukprot:997323_1